MTAALIIGLLLALAAIACGVFGLSRAEWTEVERSEDFEVWSSHRDRPVPCICPPCRRVRRELAQEVAAHA